MLNTNVAAGLCAACKHDPGCIFEADSNGAILECEQFEMEVRTGAPRPAANDYVAAAKTNGYLGLCANCDLREDCIYPKPEGGVWRCEEYK